MISRTVKIQLVVFALISVLGVVYTGLTYVGFHAALGPVKLGQQKYTVTAQFASSGGIFSNAEVTERGVIVGRVGSLTLMPNGIAVHLDLDQGQKIPANVNAQVSNLSAVGEQYINLSPQSDSGPYLKGGSVIPMARTSVPVQDATLLENVDTLVNSVDRANLATVIRELGKGFDQTGPTLQKLITQGNSLLATAQTHLPQTLTLINDGRTVLDTQNDVSDDLRAFSRNFNLLTQQFDTSDPDLRSLFDRGVQSSATLAGLLKDNQQNLPYLLSDLVTLGNISAARLPGAEQILILYPAIVADGMIDVRGGSAHFGSVSPYPTTMPNTCTSGYQSTKHRTERAGSPAYGLGGAANLNTLCTAPDGAPAGPSDARGAGLAPRPAGDTTGQPGGAVGTTASGTNGAKVDFANSVPYDATTSTFTMSDGKAYTIGTAGQDAQAFGKNALAYLLTATATP